MLMDEKYAISQQLFLQGKCIEIIEKELGSFFEVRLKSAQLISDLFIKGSLRNSEDIVNFLSISNGEIETLVETIECKLSRAINYNMCTQVTFIDINNNIKHFKQHIDDNIYEILKTEQVLGLCEKILDKSLSKIFETYLKGKITNYLLQQSNLPENILGYHSVKKQKLKHGEVIFQQLQGFMLNLKINLRNELVKSTLYLINSFYNCNENFTVA